MDGWMGVRSLRQDLCRAGISFYTLGYLSRYVALYLRNTRGSSHHSPPHPIIIFR